MKISPSTISVSRTNLSGDTFVGAGGVNSTTAAVPYPSDWAWSVNFAHSSAVATHIGSDDNYDFDSGATEVAFKTNGGAGDEGGVTQERTIAMGARYAGGITPADLPSGSVSSTLKDGVTNPNGDTINLSSSKFLTMYFKILALGSSQPGGGNLGNELYWRAADSAADAYSAAISPHNIVRKVGSTDAFKSTTTTTASNFALNEYISISYEMTDGNEGSNDWADNGLEVGSFVTEMSSGNGQSGLKLLYFGYVVSNLHNNVDAIASIDLPIAVS
jgi:hypothetical protein